MRKIIAGFCSVLITSMIPGCILDGGGGRIYYVAIDQNVPEGYLQPILDGIEEWNNSANGNWYLVPIIDQAKSKQKPWITIHFKKEGLENKYMAFNFADGNIEFYTSRFDVAWSKSIYDYERSVKSVTIHEIGHSFGLGHSSYNVMEPNFAQTYMYACVNEFTASNMKSRTNNKDIIFLNSCQKDEDGDKIPSFNITSFDFNLDNQLTIDGD